MRTREDDDAAREGEGWLVVVPQAPVEPGHVPPITVTSRYATRSRLLSCLVTSLILLGHVSLPC